MSQRAVLSPFISLANSWFHNYPHFNFTKTFSLGLRWLTFVFRFTKVLSPRKYNYLFTTWDFKYHSRARKLTFLHYAAWRLNHMPFLSRTNVQLPCFLPRVMHLLEYKCCFLTTAFQIGRLFCLPLDYSYLVSKLPRLALCYMVTVVIKLKKKHGRRS